jgi:hypothetical protein
VEEKIDLEKKERSPDADSSELSNMNQVFLVTVRCGIPFDYRWQQFNSTFSQTLLCDIKDSKFH